MQLYSGDTSNDLPLHSLPAGAAWLSLTTHRLGFDTSLQAVHLLWLCSQTSVLMIICICSPSAVPQLYLRSPGFRFSWVHNLNPLYAQFTVRVALLWEANAASDLIGRAQVVTWAVKIGHKYRWSFTDFLSTHLLLCSPVLNGPQTSSSLWPGVWGPLW